MEAANDPEMLKAAAELMKNEGFKDEMEGIVKQFKEILGDLPQEDMESMLKTITGMYGQDGIPNMETKADKKKREKIEKEGRRILDREL